MRKIAAFLCVFALMVAVAAPLQACGFAVTAKRNSGLGNAYAGGAGHDRLWGCWRYDSIEQDKGDGLLGLLGLFENFRAVSI